MPLIGYRNFDGEVPKWSPDLLPNANAQLASNCDFADGKLRSMKDGLLLRAMANNPVKGIYTEDGNLFYTWPQETMAFKSPIIDDVYDRIYYLTPSEGLLRVTNKLGMTVNGPVPADTFRVGVPRPTVAPTLRTVERTTLADYPNATLNATGWWDYNGTKYSEGAIALTMATAWKRYTFSAPALPGSPPAGVPVLVVRLQVLDPDNSNAVIMDITTRSSVTGRSQAFPGGVEAFLSVAFGGAGTVNLLWGAMEARAYTYTYENTWNEEGAPAPPAVISPTYMQDVQITPTLGDFTSYRPFSNYKFYRTYGTGTTYIRTNVTGTGPFVDSSRRPSSVGIAMLSTDWDPPQVGLAGIELMPGGWLVTFKNNILYKHEPYRPHAVPYTESFPTNIRGVRVGQSGLVVTTADGEYLVPGAAPSQLGYINLAAPQPGVSQRSMTNLDGAVAYASNDGVVLVAGSQASMDASQKLFTRKSWRARYGDLIDDFSLRFACYDGMLVATSSTQAKGFVLRLDENAGAFSRIATRMDATFRLPITDSLYYSAGANVYAFQLGADLPFDWWSKDFIFTYDVTLGAGFIETSGTIQLRIYADDVLVDTIDNIPTGFFRLASRRSKKWSVRLSGTGSVSSLQIAQSMSELKRA